MSGEPSAEGSGFRNLLHAVAARQRGLVTFGQLRRRKVSKAAISRALASGLLHQVHPGVYSVIPLPLLSFESRLAAAVLAGGEGACLCADSAAHWVGVLARRPAAIHVATRHRRAPLPGIRWHRLALADGERGHYRGMPITALERIPLDLAPTASVWELKGVLAELEYHHDIEPGQITLRRGYAGAAKLRRAIAEHTPQLADTRSQLEQAFVALLDAHGFVLPVFNATVGPTKVDATFEDQRLIIELDGVKGHSGERRVLRDHRRDLHRRRDGYTVLRYHYAQLLQDGELIAAELDRYGVRRR